MLLLIFQGGGTSTPAAVVAKGSVGRLRHTPEELERKLKKQRENTFSRRWYEELLDAQEAALEKAKETKSEKQREALIEAVAAVQHIDPAEEQAKELVRILHAAAHARRVTASIRKAEEIALLASEYDDDEEAVELLMLYG